VCANVSTARLLLARVPGLHRACHKFALVLTSNDLHMRPAHSVASHQMLNPGCLAKALSIMTLPSFRASCRMALVVLAPAA
jgi:hypothetical protein